MFSLLYSDAGYKQAGPGIEKAGSWERRNPFSTLWNVPGEAAEVVQDDTDSEWIWVRYGALETFWARDTQGICVISS